MVYRRLGQGRKRGKISPRAAGGHFQVFGRLLEVQSGFVSEHDCRSMGPIITIIASPPGGTACHGGKRETINVSVYYPTPAGLLLHVVCMQGTARSRVSI